MFLEHKYKNVVQKEKNISGLIAGNQSVGCVC